ncbi:hypothetical protein [Amycolatopsis sp. CA-128772]|uniref:hypothetical protein n=1 Tax=Amycolatopsis sp. CA-128772 TaxID=2073159 RepID=UPI000CD1C54B|nr:hypothetical protein [Amycolatopsis sp. CA-128772]
MIVALLISASALVMFDLWLVAVVVTAVVHPRLANRRLRWAVADHAEDVRNRVSLFAQLSLMGMVNTVAGAAAGLGASMYVVNSRVQFTWSIAPVFLLGITLVLVEGGGFVIGYWASRPLRKWITNPSVLEATLRKQLQSGSAPDEVLEEFSQILAELDRKLIIRRLITPDGRVLPGMRSPIAEDEWPPAGDHDPMAWARRVRADLEPYAAWRWLWRGLKAVLVLPLGLALLASGTVVALTDMVLHPNPAGAIVLAVVLVLWHALLAGLGVRAAREGIVLLNRQHALLRAKLAVCADLIQALRDLNRSDFPAPATPILSVGRWQLLRRPRVGRG